MNGLSLQYDNEQNRCLPPVALPHRPPLAHNGWRDTERWLPIRAALEDAPEGIGVLDAAMRFVVWNTAAAAITGQPAADVVGARCRLEDGRLVVDLVASAEAPAAVVFAPPATAFFEMVLRADGEASDATSVHVMLVPLLGEEFSFFVHLLRQAPSAVPWRERRGLAARHPGGSALRASAGALPDLTRREREILKLLAAGKTAKPIAVDLRLSVPTVRTHIQHILRKLGVHSCLEAAICFLQASGTDGNGHHREPVP
jgi:DNA-binding CsgD family transcriptional regulator